MVFPKLRSKRREGPQQILLNGLDLTDTIGGSLDNPVEIFV